MRNQTGWENEQSSGLCQERKSICQNRRILSGSNHQEVEDQNPEELRTTGCLMNRYSLCTAVYGKLRKASEFEDRSWSATDFSEETDQCPRSLCHLLFGIGHSTVTGIHTQRKRTIYLHWKDPRCPSFSQYNYASRIREKQKSCLYQELIQWGFLIHPQSLVRFRNSDFWNDRRHYALVDNLFLSEMNALFTRIFGVFRAFLFFSNCKTWENEKVGDIGKYHRLFSMTY